MAHFYFQWPWALVLLGLLPVWLMGYLRYQRQQWQQAFRFSYLATLEHLQNNPSVWKRLAFPLSCMVVSACLILSIARPTLITQVPIRASNILLVLDISLSMMAKDIQPNRLQAAKEAAIHFIKNLPDDSRVGLELFAGNTFGVSSPIGNHQKIIDYLNSLKPDDLQPGTAIGDAIQSGIKMMHPSPNSQKQPQQLMILMSDGDNKLGYPVAQAASNAQKSNIVIDAIGIGSYTPSEIEYQGQYLPVSFNEADLKQAAQLTQGHYFRATEAKAFEPIYKDIQEGTLEYEDRPVDVSYLFALFALGWLVIINLSLGLKVFQKVEP